MKMFFSVFAAILCAAAVLFGIYSHQQSEKAKEAKMVEISNLQLKIIDNNGAALLMNPTTKGVEDFKKNLADAKAMLGSENFPAEEARNYHPTVVVLSVTRHENFSQ